MLVATRPFSFHILTIKIPETADPNVYPGLVISTSLLTEKTRLGLDSAQPLRVHVGSGFCQALVLMDL